jgi:predicted DNA-binding transcriptional regulator AlpA
MSVDDTIHDLPLMLTDLQVARVLGLGRATVWRRVGCKCLPEPTRNGRTSRWQKAYIVGLMHTGLPCKCPTKKPQVASKSATVTSPQTVGGAS